jgi:hypothetical protein
VSPSGREVHRGATAVLSTAMLLIGVAMIVSTLARGGGPLALGFILGILFMLVGAGRLYVLRRSA